MEIFRIIFFAIILIILLSFRFRESLSRFEINRLSEHSVKHKTLAKFFDIYPGLLIFSRILALIFAILIVIFATQSWGFWGGGILSFIIILICYFIAKALREPAQKLIDSHLQFFNKYFAWTNFLGKMTFANSEPKINSEDELVHVIRDSDALSDATKNRLAGALKFRDLTVREIMTPRDKIAFIHSKDALTPVFIDELFNSGHKLFPVVQGGLDHAVGWLLLDDILPVDQEEKILTEHMRKLPPPVASAALLDDVLRQMCEHHCAALLVAKDEKIVGMITLGDLVRALVKSE